ncbi:hypothetical protein [Cellulomonas endophytica]|uniref:hypothetical protein n=1 Tax=Cellulomonas endophytica TaxID=2494735 RepID=UPI0010110B56|nr:hypothetical protein [Cellulomonas endophytica]
MTVPAPRRPAPRDPLRRVPARRVPAAPPAAGRAVTVVLDVPAGAGYPADHELVELAEVLRDMAQELAPWVRSTRVTLEQTPGG